MKLSDIAILNINNSDYRCIIGRISKSEAVNLLKNADLTEKIGTSEHLYFIGYFYDDNQIKALHIVLPKRSAHVKSYDDQTKRVCFLLEDNDLLEKYNTIWDKVSTNIKEEFDSELVYNKKTFENQNKILRL